MSIDIKDRYQRKADELAEEKHGKDFYELSADEQYSIYNKAMVLVDDKLIAESEHLRDCVEGR